jgi:hypothetical protein
MAMAGYHFLDSMYRWVPEHGYVLVVSAERLAELESDIAGSNSCSQGVTTIPIAMRRRDMLCFVSAKRGYLTHVARSVVYYGAESGKDKLEIWNLTSFTQPVRIAHIKSQVKGKQAWRAHRALGGGHVSPTAFKLIKDALQRADPRAARIAEDMVDRRPPPQDPTPSNAKVNWACQRDAVVTALEIAGIPKEQLHTAAQLGAGASSELSSIFDTDENVTTIEDLAILKDFDEPDEDWQFLVRQHYPAKTFHNGETKLTVILANKLPLETQLGVDLIYVNETLNAVVFVQYKMFAGIDGEEGYRPNTQLDKEIARMDEATAKLSAVNKDESCDGYRYGNDPFFLKFCSKLLTHETSSHVPGLYVPVSYWKRLLKLHAGKGKKGGTVFYRDTFGKRYFTPSHFIDMVDRGWIGTSAMQTQVLVAYLKEMLKGKRGVVLALKSRVETAEDNGEDSDARRRPPQGRKPKYPGKPSKTAIL